MKVCRTLCRAEDLCNPDLCNLLKALLVERHEERLSRSCPVCASRKGPRRQQHPKLQSIPVGGPFHTVGVDVVQLPHTLEGNQYAIVFVNYLTKWPEVFAVPDQTSNTIA